MPVTGDTQLAATKQELIAETAQRALFSESIILPTVKDVSSFAKKGAEAISFPNYSALFAPENRASGAAGTVQDSEFGKDTMLLDERATILWVIDSMDEIESTLDVQREYITAAAAAHAVDVDVKLIAEMDAAADLTTTAGTLSQDIILEMRTKLLRNKARLNRMFMAISPEEEAALLKFDPFVSAEQYGSAVIPEGVLGRIYGVNVIVTPELADGQYFMYDSYGIGAGFQKRPSFDEQKAVEYGSGAMKQVLDQKYGVKALQVDVANSNAALGKSAFIVKDNN